MVALGVHTRARHAPPPHVLTRRASAQRIPRRPFRQTPTVVASRHAVVPGTHAMSGGASATSVAASVTSGDTSAGASGATSAMSGVVSVATSGGASGATSTAPSSEHVGLRAVGNGIERDVPGCHVGRRLIWRGPIRAVDHDSIGRLQVARDVARGRCRPLSPTPTHHKKHHCETKHPRRTATRLHPHTYLLSRFSRMGWDLSIDQRRATPRSASPAAIPARLRRGGPVDLDAFSPRR